MTSPADPDRIARLSATKRALLEARRRGRAGQPVPADHIPALSFAQERLWLLAEVTPGMSAYNTTRVVRLSAALDERRLRRALSSVVARHEVLRTRITSDAGRPVAELSTQTDVQLEVINSANEEVARRQIAGFAGRPFDLTAEPLLRAMLIKVADGDDLLALSLHHIASDEASRTVLWHELATAYDLADGRPDDRQPIPLQYAEFARQQRIRAAGEEFSTEVEWWAETLAGAPAALTLPLDHERPTAQSYAGARYRVDLSPEVVTALRSWCREAGTTLFTAVVAPFAWLLGQWAQQSDVVLGMPVSGRDRPETEGMIGLFVNTVALRTDCAGTPSYSELVQRLRDSLVAALSHQDVPFEKVVEAVAPRRDLSRNPIFQVLVNSVQTDDDRRYEIGGVSADALDFDPGTTKFDLGLLVAEHRDRGVDLVIEYDTSLFEPATIEALADELRTLISTALEQPSRPLEPADALSEAQREALVTTANATAAPYPGGGLHEWFERQVMATPDRLAVGDDNTGWISYQQLDERANQLAHHLVGLGVGPDVPVAVSVPRSVEMEVAILAVLKAGGCYVPLDPSYPHQRLTFMLADCQAKVLITTDAVAGQLPSHPQTLLMDDLPEGVGALPATTPVTGVGADNLAYIIYTSGSTGTPKGVMVEHAGVVNRLAWMQEAFGLTSDDTVLQKTPLSFDVSVWEVLWPLLVGARLAMARPDGQRDVAYLAEVIGRQSVTVMHFVPSMLEVFLDQVPGERIRTLRLVVCSGEALATETKERFFEVVGEAELFNLYGPTEASIDVTSAQCLPGRQHPVRIGAPIANMAVYVVDSAGRPLPVGMPGELLLAGVGLARGYLGRPELTTERFVASDLTPSGRVYRTGDLVRWTSSGQIDYLGRIDGQVKLRGFRIELGEIEAVLAAHPSVAHAAAAIKLAPSGEPALGGYVVFREPDADLSATSSDSDQIGDWQTVWERTYSADADVDFRFDIRGWTSSITGKPIPAAEMAEWVDSTVERIAGLGAERILEIGSGSGLLLWRLAPTASVYAGTDFSSAVCERLRYNVVAAGLEQVQVDNLSADRIGEAATDQVFDTVIVNSVVQYFPSLGYLDDVLTTVVSRLDADGRIFIGDVRSLPLHLAFCYDVVTSHSDQERTDAALAEQVMERRGNDSELVIDPAYFLSLPHRLPAIGHVQVMPKRGRHRTEMNCYRYDVVLHVGAVPTMPVADWLDWQGDGLDADRLAELLAESPDVVAIRNVRDARTAATVDAATALTSGPPPGSSLAGPIDVDDLFELAGRLGFGLELSCAGSDPGCFDAVFRRRVEGLNDFATDRRPAPAALSNDPPAGRERRSWRREQLADIDRLLRERLPDYMVPNALRPVSRLPLSPSGKLDRDALPPLVDLHSTVERVLPRTPMEELVATIWQELLGVAVVGIDDDFFALGGQSLLAARLVAGIERASGERIALSAVFDAPTVRGLAEEIARVAEADSSHVQVPVVAVDRAGHRIAPDRVGDANSLAAAAIGEGSSPEGPTVFSVSAAQERMWFLDQLDPDTPLYIARRSYRVRGQLDTEALQSALDELVARHESLRTTIATAAGVPYQVVHAPSPFALSMIDVSKDAEPDLSAQRLASEEARQPFDLALGPLAIASVYRLASDDHVLVLRFHHLIIDGWSIDVLVDELAQAYQRTAGIDAPAPLQYVDFSMWQQATIDDDAVEAQLAYWRNKLGGAPAAIDLPTDHPRPEQVSHAGGKLSWPIPDELSNALAVLARNRSTTPFVVLVAACVSLLQRLSGQDDIVVGTPIAGRQRDEVTRTVGLFANTLALRTDTSGNPSFIDLLDRVKATVTEAQQHADVPFERIVQELRPERDPSRNPIFQVMVNLQPPSTGGVALADLTLTPYELDAVVSRFDLSFSFVDRDGALTLSLEYATDLFDADTATGTVRRLEQVISAVTADPRTRVGALPVLLDEEERTLLQWAGSVGRRGGASTLELIAAAVAAHPDRVAVRDEQNALTYAQLWQRSEELARGLAHRVAPGSRVGIMIDRDLRLVTTALAIWRAGAAYVPLDPSYPVDRLHFMLEDSGVEAVVCDENLVSLLPEALRGLAVTQSELAAVDDTGADWVDRPGDIAYVIYTSGSTGRPKGVVIGHPALTNLLTSMRSAPGCTDTDVLLAVTTFSFDIAGLEFFLPLICGAEVVVASRAVAADPVKLAAAIDRLGVTILQATPSTWRMLVEHDWVSPRPLRALCGGEPLVRELSADLLPRVTELWNCYGPTETTIWSTAERIRDPANITIGRPIGNTTTYVVDRYGRLAPIGVIGELCIGGHGVAEGYWHRDDLTAERFVPDLYRSPERMYRTGDLARWRPDGRLTCLGRTDNQVKVRGHRIELGEIEAALERSPAVAEAAVIVREDNPGDQRLVGYVTGAAPDDRAPLLDSLRDTLPAYMVPATLVVLDEMPRTLNGKTDRRALPAPGDGDYDEQSGAPFVTDTERQLAEVWSEVLRTRVSSATSDFFALGGHSLLATRLLARVADRLGVTLPLRTVFATPTLRGMAELVDREPASADQPMPVDRSRRRLASERLNDTAAVLAAANGRGDPTVDEQAGVLVFPTTATQTRMWVLHQLWPTSNDYNVPILRRVTGELDEAVLRAALADLAALHEVARTTFAQVGDTVVQLVRPQSELPLEITDLADGAESGLKVASHLAAEPFDLKTGPVLRADLLRESSGNSLVMLTAHHIALDGWSIDLLLTDLVERYNARLRGEASASVVPALQIGDVAVWERGQLQADVRTDDATYWREQLWDATPSTALPVDHADQDPSDHRGARVRVRIIGEDVRQLRAVAASRQATPFMLMTAVVSLLLHRHGAEPDITIGTPFATRTFAGGETTVGPLINTLPLRLSRLDQDTFSDLLTRFAVVATDGYRHGDYPYAQLVEDLSERRTGGDRALYRVLIDSQTHRPALDHIGSAQLSEVEIDWGVARHDLAFRFGLGDEVLDVTIEYRKALFDESTIENMLARLVHLTRQAVTSPDSPLNDLEVLPADELAALESWSETAKPSSTLRLPERIAHITELHPDAVAVEDATQRLTYAELDRAATALAHELRQRGVGGGPGQYIAVAVGHTVEWPIAALAAWKAGVGFVPIDPTYPAERQRYMLTDSGASIVVTDQNGLERLREYPVTAISPGLAPESIPDFEPAVLDDRDPAYLIYTSGTSGLPKGVAVAHGALRNLTDAIERRVHAERVGPHRVSVNAPVSFDASIQQLLHLGYGDTLVLIPDEVRIDPDACVGYIADRRISLLDGTPTHLRMLVQSGLFDECPALMTLLVGGEAIDDALWGRLRDSGRRVFNVYGPTEVTVDSVVADVSVSSAPVIGRPLPNVVARVADTTGRWRPRGVAGELWLGGAQLATGYHNRTELTDERFVTVSGRRWYRTGDRVALTPDGNLRYLGRLDDQVKIRGHRVEPGEVAHALLAQPEVFQAVVLPRVMADGNLALVGCVVARDDADLSAVRDRIRRLLPSHLVPSALVSVPDIPRLSNGKVDVRALDALELPAPSHGSGRAPEGPTETLVAELCGEILDLSDISADDDFFDLGGNSLSAARFVTMLRAMGIELPLVAIFDNSTISGIADLVEQALLTELNASGAD
jgi:amino acid adenylation domain-containing protein